MLLHQDWFYDDKMIQFYEIKGTEHNPGRQAFYDLETENIYIVSEKGIAPLVIMELTQEDREYYAQWYEQYVRYISLNRCKWDAQYFRYIKRNAEKEKCMIS